MLFRSVLLINGAATKLLFGPTVEPPVGLLLKDIVPPIAELLENGKRSGIVQFSKSNELLTLAVKASASPSGQVVTFEDITRQLLDQRQAAWSDVARRIAHEIKNPLTPIQLSAERIKRKFRREVAQPEELDALAETGGVALVQRAQDADCGHHAGAGVADIVAGLHRRVLRVARHRKCAAHRNLRHEALARARHLQCGAHGDVHRDLARHDIGGRYFGALGGFQNRKPRRHDPRDASKRTSRLVGSYWRVVRFT